MLLVFGSDWLASDVCCHASCNPLAVWDAYLDSLDSCLDQGFTVIIDFDIGC